MSAKHYHITQATAPEIETIIEWARDEGWNPGINDAALFELADPSGFFVGCLDGEIIASGSCVNYDQSYAFLGLYIVKAAFRKQGYGMPMFQHLLAHAHHRNLGLDGVLQNVSLYEQSGFHYFYENKRFESHAMEAPLSDHLVPLHSIPFESIKHYDRQCFPAPRDAFLKAWITQSQGVSIGYVEDGVLKGYAVRRRCTKGHKIGPLFADNVSIAEALYAGLQHGIPGEPLYLDVPEINQDAMLLAEKYRMKYVFGCARMYSLGQPAIDEHKVFGVTTFEIG